jgi:hypothetical protein
VQAQTVDYIDADTEIKPEGYQATVVTTKPCKLLSIPSTDLLRFGGGVKEAVQTAAWARRESLAERAARSAAANASLAESADSTRRVSGARPAGGGVIASTVQAPLEAAGTPHQLEYQAELLHI